MSEPYRPLALIHDGDSFFIDVIGLSPRTVKIERVLRFANNQNVVGVEHKFFDLEPEVRSAVMAQVQRRYKGLTIRV